jgi:hypothetical protein
MVPRATSQFPTPARRASRIVRAWVLPVLVLVTQLVTQGLQTGTTAGCAAG